MPEVSSALTAVVLNWRTASDALAARAALVADGVAPERVLLVDNGSDDGSPERLGRGAPDAPLLALSENEGFARANNRAAAHLPAERCFLFVNADAFVHRSGSVAALVAAVARPEVAIAVPRLLDPDLGLQRSVVPLAAPLPALVRAAGLSRWVPNRWQPRFGAHFDHRASRVIQAADGPVLAVDADAFRSVGGFDETTFMYGEDHALFRALARRGGTAWFVAEAEFVHRRGGASTQRWDEVARAERVGHAEGVLLLATTSSATRAHVALAAMTYGAGVRALASHVRGRRRAAAVQAAWWRGYRAAARRAALK